MTIKIENLFEAKASNPLEIASLYNGSVGFMIPEYQRQYDWSEGNIDRLFQDILNGFQRLSDSARADACAFLGTLILVREESQEESFSGQSVAIVDGQQRLTTLALFACALCEELRRHLLETDFSKLNDKTSKWLKEETNERRSAVGEFVIGSQKVTSTQLFPFPRIVRHRDRRGKSKGESEYKSPIGKFLEGFAEHLESDDVEYKPPPSGKDADARKLTKNYQTIRTLVKNLNNAKWYEDTECDQFAMKCVSRRQCRDLFERLPDYIRDQNEQNRAVATVAKTTELHDLTRTLLFSAYFCNYIVLIRVITENESAAFEIFDALNTTGEPLTALQTLRPRVIFFENATHHYAGSPSEQAFEAIRKYLDGHFSTTLRKQTETKELVVIFALYLKGQKLPKDLATQRNFLRTSYEVAVDGGETSARKHTSALARVALFREHYWRSDGIEKLWRFHNTEALDLIQLLMSLISAMKTSLALPILLRYWNPYLKTDDKKEKLFLDVLKAVAAFLVIRRAATGDTAGIDSDFRAIMAPKEGRGADRKFHLCAGIRHENDVLSLSELKEALRTLLRRKFESFHKATWVNRVVATPLYSRSQDLVRFLILAAADGAVPSSDEPGTWNKVGNKARAQENRFLTFAAWGEESCATVKLVAPETRGAGNRWPQDLYQDNALPHSIGNLTLFPRPAKEKSATGSDSIDSWERKRMFYLALTEKAGPEQKEALRDAEDDGVGIPVYALKLIESGKRLPLLDPLRDVDEWNRDVVLRRGRNIAGLCWDVVWPWLN